jgi:hypothetical protein
MSKLLMLLKGVGKVVVALAPALMEWGKAARERLDPRNYGTKVSLKEHAREEKYEDKCLKLADEITDELMARFNSKMIDNRKHKRLYILIDHYRKYRAKT